jgi:hypothetical protein
MDAEILAQLLAADCLPAVWRPDSATAALRRQVLRRAHMVRQLLEGVAAGQHLQPDVHVRGLAGVEHPHRLRPVLGVLRARDPGNPRCRGRIGPRARRAGSPRRMPPCRRRTWPRPCPRGRRRSVGLAGDVEERPVDVRGGDRHLQRAGAAVGQPADRPGSPAGWPGSRPARPPTGTSPPGRGPSSCTAGSAAGRPAGPRPRRPGPGQRWPRRRRPSAGRAAGRRPQSYGEPGCPAINTSTGSSARGEVR